jgi:hypothetical protein
MLECLAEEMKADQEELNTSHTEIKFQVAASQKEADAKTEACQERRNEVLQERNNSLPSSIRGLLREVKGQPGRNGGHSGVAGTL